jgi:hypothetical protein
MTATIDIVGRVGIGVAFAGIAIGGCMPPPMNIGYVDLDPGGLGHADIQGQVGGGAEMALPLGGGGVAAHFEPFVARKWSIPIGTGLGVSGAEYAAAGHFPLRVGFRHRAIPKFLAWGMGLGPSVVFDDDFADVSGVADLELVLGTSAHRVGFSFGMRPAFSFDANHMTFYTLLEPAVAIPVQRSSITIALLGGPWVTPTIEGTPAGGFLGAAIGVHRGF